MNECEVLQYCVRGNTWFGCYSNSSVSYSFVGCTVSPPFQFCDFELASRSALYAEYEYSEKDKLVIEKLTEGLPWHRHIIHSVLYVMVLVIDLFVYE